MCDKRYYLLHGISDFRSVIDEIVANCLCESDRLAAAVAINEALTNAFVHGNTRDNGKPILLTACMTTKYLTVTVRDCGPGIDGYDLNGSATPDPWDENGRGFFLIRHYADDVQIRGSAVEIRRRLCASTENEGCP